MTASLQPSTREVCVCVCKEESRVEQGAAVEADMKPVKQQLSVGSFWCHHLISRPVSLTDRQLSKVPLTTANMGMGADPHIPLLHQHTTSLLYKSPKADKLLERWYWSSCLHLHSSTLWFRFARQEQQTKENAGYNNENKSFRGVI